MNQPHDDNEPRVVHVDPQQPVGGAIIDAHGQEVPITEKMIQHACEELDDEWFLAPAKN
ncbi:MULTISPECIES: PA1571 family protein [Pseudomonas]|uniref:Multifunctional fatty acid oxidation complex subunit alpha n=1 Tax=Pseudomonas kuykendallii TaxID=1007099 RepID=A0A1H3BC92_9PSED|nr:MULTISPECIES: PA1571 family protein [Pseudomonas]MCQ4269967.1 hypothetical protein [Pseudomonas kuykendallii]SDX39650.1 hypothetical protein SAMN05216287_2794 [Pseudomonas kuykendallii]